MNASAVETIYESTEDKAALTSVVDLVKLSDQYRQSAILHYAVADKLFDLTQTGRTPAEVAASFGMVESKAAILLHALAALGLLTKDGDAFRNTALSALSDDDERRLHRPDRRAPVSAMGQLAAPRGNPAQRKAARVPAGKPLRARHARATRSTTRWCA